MSAPLAGAVRRMRNQRTDIRWILSTASNSPMADLGVEIDSVRDAVDVAVAVRSKVARIRGEAVLRRMGVKVQGIKGDKPAARATNEADLNAEIPASEPPALLGETRRELAPEIKENV